MNAIREIQKLGQSLWYDNIRRGLIDSGELAQLIAQGITGITSNPTIFEKAIDGSSDYDAAIRALSQKTESVDELYDALVLEDIARGADLLLPVYQSSHGKDGYISIEVPPTMAEHTDATIAEAHRLFRALNRPNIMIKVPATPEGIPAIRRLIADGINVNVTLIFSLDAYRDVIEAYLAGLEERLSKNLALDQVASVASFFVSRVDTLVDRLLDEKKANSALKGKAAIANAKMAYQVFLQHFQDARFQRLREHGAMVQRPLWASTSTKNPNYPDLLYVEALIGPDTVDTLPPATVDAILDHGRAERGIEQGLEEARQVLSQLEAQGIAMKTVTDQLLKEGVESFHQSFVTLRESLEKKRTQRPVQDGTFHLKSFQTVWETTLDQLNHDRALPRLWEHDASLWSTEPAHVKIIEGALGWLNVAERVVEDVPGLTRFFQQAVLDGFEHAVVLGMGGSSLVSDVLIHSFPPGKPGLALSVLDTTNPNAIEELTRQLPLDKTLFLVASKSGTTTEPNAFYHYFWDIVSRKGLDPARQFVAITDPGTAMVAEAEGHHFRHIFLNPADIGGRYSALSWFGMVPATLYGLDTARLLQEALTMTSACQRPDARSNPGALLGAALGTLARQGRDKVTLVMPESISHFGDWLEQLLAESTGKLGTGLIPVAHEPSYAPNHYSQDRVFVVYQESPGNAPVDIQALQDAGHPVIVYTLSDPYSLGQEFYRWEIATAIAGSLLHIDAFDQPNVQESKDNTKAILGRLTDGKLPAEDASIQDDLQWTASDALRKDSLQASIKSLLAMAGPSSYVAVMAYLNPSQTLDGALGELRRTITDRTGSPTTMGYGPRFLHSTGQLHKGGPATGLYLQLVGSNGPHLPVPRDGYDFSTLMHAQALGDFQSLIAHGRAVVRIILPEPGAESVAMLTSWLE